MQLSPKNVCKTRVFKIGQMTYDTFNLFGTNEKRGSFQVLTFSQSNTSRLQVKLGVIGISLKDTKIQRQSISSKEPEIILMRTMTMTKKTFCLLWHKVNFFKLNKNIKPFFENLGKISPIN